MAGQTIGQRGEPVDRRVFGKRVGTGWNCLGTDRRNSAVWVPIRSFYGTSLEDPPQRHAQQSSVAGCAAVCRRPSLPRLVGARSFRSNLGRALTRPSLRPAALPGVLSCGFGLGRTRCPPSVRRHDRADVVTAPGTVDHDHATASGLGGIACPFRSTDAPLLPVRLSLGGPISRALAMLRPCPRPACSPCDSPRSCRPRSR